MSDQTIASGKHVSLTYSITDDAGNVLEQSDLPVGYIHGGCTELIGGMDQAITGKTLQVNIQIQEVRAPTDEELMEDASGASCSTPSALH